MIPFLNWSKIYLGISLTLILMSIAGILLFGFTPSIEFAGGSNLEYRFQGEIKEDSIREVFEDKTIQVGDITVVDGVLRIRSSEIPQEMEAEIRSEIEKRTDTKLTVLKVETVGPSMSTDTINKTITATVAAIIAILLYIAWAFRNVNYAISAIVALFHDIFILIGSLTYFTRFMGAELDILFVTAALTTMSFSVHDTIVMFDQLRMYTRKHGSKNIEYYANKSITDTFMRSLNNSLTIVFMLLALVLLGGSTIKFFAVFLLIGTIIGTYSSPFVSIPLAVWLEKKKKKKDV